MPTLEDLAAQLVGEVPGLPHLFARNYINQALKDISKDRLWSWNVSEGIILAPQLITTGAVETTQFSTTITFDTDAQAAILPQLLSNPPLLTRQFRVSGGPVYNLIGYDPGTGVGTLDRIYAEATASNQGFQIYKCYYGAPTVDGTTIANNFLRYLSILDPINGYVIGGKDLSMTRDQLNKRDPMRGAQGQPYYTASYRPQPYSNAVNPNTISVGQMLYEWWPSPVYQQAYMVQFQTMALQLTPGQEFPNQFPEALVRFRAQDYAFRWARQNMGRIPMLKGVDWQQSLREVQQKYSIELVGAKKQDTEIMPTILRPGRGNNGIGPIDAKFMQSHDFPMW